MENLSQPKPIVNTQANNPRYRMKRNISHMTTIQYILKQSTTLHGNPSVQVDKNSILVTQSGSEDDESFQELDDQDMINIWVDIAKNIELKHWKCLSSLKFRHFDCFLITDQTLTLFGLRVSQYFEKLQKLDVNFEGCASLTIRGFEPFIMRLTRHLPQLKELSLNFSNCGELQDKALQLLGSNMKQVLQLQSLQIIFGFCPHITIKGLNILMHHINKRLVNLKHLVLDFRVCDPIREKDFDNFIFHLTHRIPDLKGFTLQLECKSNSEDEISHTNIAALLSKITGKLCHLTQLGLDFGMFYKMSNETLQTIGSQIGANLPDLLHLDISCPTACDLDNKGVKHFVKQLFPCLTKLTELKLKFQDTEKLSNEMLKALSSGIKTHLSNLQKLSLNFRWCRNIGDRGLGFLTDSLTSLNKLQNLKLYFSCCENITEGFASLVKCIYENLLTLKRLTLDFENSAIISNGRVKTLMCQIGNNLLQLEKFSVNINSRHFVARRNHLTLNENLQIILDNEF